MSIKAGNSEALVQVQASDYISRITNFSFPPQKKNLQFSNVKGTSSYFAPWLSSLSNFDILTSMPFSLGTNFHFPPLKKKTSVSKG
jgi:hypothetical protein